MWIKRKKTKKAKRKPLSCKFIKNKPKSFSI